jgi:hypothetical protein
MLALVGKPCVSANAGPGETAEPTRVGDRGARVCLTVDRCVVGGSMSGGRGVLGCPVTNLREQGGSPPRLWRSRRLGAEPGQTSPNAKAIHERALVSVRKVNIVSVEGDEALDVAGFRHVQTSVRARLGAHAIGATVYLAYAGQPIWPYGYQHGVEEWLYVISGAPVLREPAGEQELAPGAPRRFDQRPPRGR